MAPELDMSGRSNESCGICKCKTRIVVKHTNKYPELNRVFRVFPPGGLVMSSPVSYHEGSNPDLPKQRDEVQSE